MAGPDESVCSQDQPQYTDKSNVAGPAEGLCENVKAETGSKQIEQSDQYSDTEEIFNSDSKSLFHINHHAGAAPAQKGMKTGRRKIARLLVKYA